MLPSNVSHIYEDTVCKLGGPLLSMECSHVTITTLCDMELLAWTHSVLSNVSVWTQNENTWLQCCDAFDVVGFFIADVLLNMTASVSSILLTLSGWMFGQCFWCIFVCILSLRSVLVIFMLLNSVSVKLCTVMWKCHADVCPQGGHLISWLRVLWVWPKRG